MSATSPATILTTLLSSVVAAQIEAMMLRGAVLAAGDTRLADLLSEVEHRFDSLNEALVECLASAEVEP